MKNSKRIPEARVVLRRGVIRGALAALCRSRPAALSSPDDVFFHVHMDGASAVASVASLLALCFLAGPALWLDGIPPAIPIIVLVFVVTAPALAPRFVCVTDTQVVVPVSHRRAEDLVLDLAPAQLRVFGPPDAPYLRIAAGERCAELAMRQLGAAPFAALVALLEARIAAARAGARGR